MFIPTPALVLIIGIFVAIIIALWPKGAKTSKNDNKIVIKEVRKKPQKIVIKEVKKRK